MKELWRKIMVKVGLGEEEEYEEEEEEGVEEEEEEEEDFEEDLEKPKSGEPARVRKVKRGPDLERARRALRSVGSTPSRVYVVEPRDFGDAQKIADKFKAHTPVVINFKGVGTDLSKRLMDFTSGLIYALDGGMERVGEKVFLLTPKNVEIAAEEKKHWREKGLFRD